MTSMASQKALILLAILCATLSDAARPMAGSAVLDGAVFDANAFRSSSTDGTKTVRDAADSADLTAFLSPTNLMRLALTAWNNGAPEGSTLAFEPTESADTETEDYAEDYNGPIDFPDDPQGLAVGESEDTQDAPTKGEAAESVDVADNTPDAATSGQAIQEVVEEMAARAQAAEEEAEEEKEREEEFRVSLPGSDNEIVAFNVAAARHAAAAVVDAAAAAADPDTAGFIGIEHDEHDDHHSSADEAIQVSNDAVAPDSHDDFLPFDLSGSDNVVQISTESPTSESGSEGAGVQGSSDENEEASVELSSPETHDDYLPAEVVQAKEEAEAEVHVSLPGSDNEIVAYNVPHKSDSELLTVALPGSDQLIAAFGVPHRRN